jgi:hypothetical protein
VQVAQNFIEEINIQIINRCNLLCSFCPRANITREQLREIEATGAMSLGLFKTIVDKCIQAGITRFCLTPRMGEVLLDPTLHEKLAYLEGLSNVKEYFFSTNLTLNASKLIEYVNNSSKCTLEISYYGGKEIFCKVTQGDEKLYRHFVNNLSRISASLKHKQKITIFQRFLGEEKLPIIKMLISQGVIYNTKETRNYNIGGLLKNEVPLYTEIKRTGQCPTKLTGCILINGDFNLCYMNDVFNTMTQGSILNTDLRVLRKEAKLDGFECCRMCDESW